MKSDLSEMSNLCEAIADILYKQPISLGIMYIIMAKNSRTANLNKPTENLALTMLRLL